MSTRGTIAVPKDYLIRDRNLSVNRIIWDKPFAIEGLETKGAADFPEIHVDNDCRCYCQTCNKYVELKKGDRIPPCCGKLMEVMD